MTFVIRGVTIAAARIVLLMIVFCIIAAFIARSVDGSDCRQFFYKQQAVVVQQVAYVQPYYAPLVYYSAGLDIQAEALSEKITRRVLQQIQAPQKQQVQAPQKNIQPVQAPRQQQVQAPQKENYHSAPLQPLPETRGGVLARKCAECHSGAAPKKGITIDGNTPMFSDQITAAVRMIRDDKMPKGGPPLTPDEKGQALEELLSLERMSNAQAPPVPQPDTEEITPQPAIQPNQQPRPQPGDLQ